jgi:hypothetical protein
LNKDPKKRPALKDIKKDPFFAEIDWDKLFRKEINPPLILSKDNLKKDEVDEKMAAPKDKKELEELVNNIDLIYNLE